MTKKIHKPHNVTRHTLKIDTHDSEAWLSFSYCVFCMYMCNLILYNVLLFLNFNSFFSFKWMLLFQLFEAPASPLRLYVCSHYKHIPILFFVKKHAIKLTHFFLSENFVNTFLKLQFSTTTIQPIWIGCFFSFEMAERAHSGLECRTQNVYHFSTYICKLSLIIDSK